jgi:hypothetical protein
MGKASPVMTGRADQMRQTAGASALAVRPDPAHREHSATRDQHETGKCGQQI